uniref:Heme-binding protein soul5 n=1 Tax=Sinocyclocheilus rhinocerous TaxID=307959 RepID=A0A673G2C5_9TELE
RICLTGLILLLFAVAVDGRVGNSTSESSYCTETKECFLFDLVCAGDGYEVRHYDAAKWVTTEAESYFMEIATSRAFRKLYKYITGENEAGEFVWGSNIVEDQIFLLPSKYQANPPKPTDPSVYLTDTPDMKVYADSLKTSLDNVQATYETEYHYNVGYNSPMKIMNRHNEAWFIVKGEPVCPSSG